MEMIKFQTFIVEKATKINVRRIILSTKRNDITNKYT